jgi:DNA-binding LytR/AlgR family response regulator
VKIAVCDDEYLDRKKTTEYLKRYSEEKLLEIEIDEFQNGCQLLAAFERTYYKVFLLDIYMDGKTQVDIAYQIRARDDECAIIFITSSPDFRSEGFEVGATHYLVKPVAYEGIESAMNRCKSLFTYEEYILKVLVNKNPVEIRMKDIIFVEVYGKKLLINLPDNIIETRMPLAEIEKLLPKKLFLRCHRCYIVNMCKIAGLLEKDFLMNNNIKIPIHKNNNKTVKKIYHDFLFRSFMAI